MSDYTTDTDTDTVTSYAGRPYGHVPGHDFLDVEIEIAPSKRSGYVARLAIVNGHSQGCRARDQQEHGREEYARYASSPEAALDEVVRVAKRETAYEAPALRGYIETAASAAIRGLEELAGQEAAA